jgi:DNA-binding CsgD family transcriptional regulator
LERLGPSDYEAVLAFLRQLYAIRRAETFPRHAMTGLARLIPSDILTYNEIDTRQRRATAVVEPAGSIPAWGVATLGRLTHQHPLVTHYARTRDRQPRKISDFLSLSQFRKLDLYNELFGPLSINFQMAVTIPSAPGLVIGVAFNRSRRDFSERDRALLEAIRPHLAQAYRNVAERANLAERALVAQEAALTAREHEVLVLVADGRTNPEIADRLSVSPRTVQKHLEHVYEKLGVSTRTAAAMKLNGFGSLSQARSPSA